MDIQQHKELEINRFLALIGRFTDLPRKSLRPDALITEADRRLYRAKGAGRERLIDASASSRL